MQIKSHVPFIPEADLEALADALLERYEQEIEPIFAPPVPIEPIADFLLELSIEWLDIPDTEDEPILAYLSPDTKAIRLNERRLPYFEQYPGAYAFTLAHEIGHYQLHLTQGDAAQDQVYLCRHRQTVKDRREWQAERFASYLLMPSSLLWPALDGVNLQRWSDLYQLRDQFNVSITALKIRLEELGCLHVTADGQLHPTEAAATRARRQQSRRLAGMGNFYQTVGELRHAIEAYRQAIELARTMSDRREEAFLSWNLGLLLVETDPPRAVELMSVCVIYEREIDHPDAEADAAYVAKLEVGQ